MCSFVEAVEEKVGLLEGFLDPSSPNHPFCDKILLSLRELISAEKLRLSGKSIPSNLGGKTPCALSQSDNPLRGVSQASRQIRKPTVPIQNTFVLRSRNPKIVASAKKKLEDSDLLRSGQANVVHFNSHLRGVSYIHCDSFESKNTLKSFLSNSGFPVRDPCIVDSFVSVLVPNSFIANLSKEQIKNYLEKRDPKFKNKTFLVEEIIGKGSKSIVVLRVQNELFEEIRREQFTFFGLDRLYFKPWFKLIQCFKCSAFGHASSRCASATLHCPHCSLGHSLEKCSKLTRACRNCQKRDLPSDHSSFSKSCPVRREFINSHKTEF